MAKFAYRDDTKENPKAYVHDVKDLNPQMGYRKISAFSKEDGGYAGGGIGLSTRQVRKHLKTYKQDDNG